MTGAQSVALAVGLLAPLGAAVVVMARTSAADRVVPVSATVAAIAWGVLVVTGAQGGVSVFHVSPLVAAGACGAAVLTAVADGRGDRRSAIGALVALVAVCVGLTGGGESGQVLVAGAVFAGLGVAAAVSVEALAPDDRRLALPLVVVGLGAAAVGFVVLWVRADRWSIPSTGTLPRAVVIAFLLAGAALTVAGTLRSRRPAGVLLVGGLMLGLAAAPLRPGGADLAALAIVLAVLGSAAAATGRAPAAVGLLALAAAAGPAALLPASRLLAAGSVVITAVDRPAVVLAAVPGAVALAAGVVEDGGSLATALAVIATLVAVALAAKAAVSTDHRRPVATADHPARVTLGTVPAAIAGAWLALWPGSWTWTGAELGSYDRGMTLALAAAALTVGAAAVAPWVRRSETRRRRPVPSAPRARQLRSPWSRRPRRPRFEGRRRPFG